LYRAFSKRDIYKILEQIIVMQANTQENSELISSGVLRQEIIVSKEIWWVKEWSVILPLTVCYEMLPKAWQNVTG
jgi:hypothetical protein